MSNLLNLSFASPWAFLLLLLLPLGIWWYRRQWGSRYPNLRLPGTAALEGTGTWRLFLMQWLPYLRLAAFVSLVVALARPQLTLKEESVTAEGIDIMLVMDLSSSMLAQDFQPNRLEVSKAVAIDFVSKRGYDRIGLVAFAGEAFTQCPLTTDHAVVRTFLSGLACGALEDGTAIGMGLATAVNRLKDSEAESKVVILLTDGVNNTGYQSPELAAEIAQEFGVRVYTIGVGTQGEALTPVSRGRDGRYRYDIAKVEIDEELLQYIAELTEGRYFRATSEEALQEIYGIIDELEKTEIETTVIRRYSEEFGWFLGLALVLLLIEFLLRYTVLRGIP